METLRDRIVHWLARRDEGRREIVLATLLIVVLLSVGTFGYAILEGWSLMDGLYMTFITLTTIGFGEVRELSDAGRIFTILIGIIGIGTVAFVAGRAVQLLLAGERLRERQIMRRIRSMHEHYVICGYGRIGRRVAEDLRHTGANFVVIDRSENRIEALREQGIPAILGDAEEEATLREAGLERAQWLIITLPDDATNIFVTLVAKEINPRIRILSRTSDAKNQSKLRQAGAAKVVAPSDVGADRMAQVILRPHVDEFMEEVLKTSSLGLQMDEVTVQEHSPLAGRTLAESHFRQQFDAIVIAIVKHAGGADPGDALDGDGRLRFNPSPNDRIEAGDVLIVLGSNEMIRRLQREGCTAPA